jgi:hypothetical protein
MRPPAERGTAAVAVAGRAPPPGAPWPCTKSGAVKAAAANRAGTKVVVFIKMANGQSAQLMDNSCTSYPFFFVIVG